jgi:hypothetical protein
MLRRRFVQLVGRLAGRLARRRQLAELNEGRLAGRLAGMPLHLRVCLYARGTPAPDSFSRA